MWHTKAKKGIKTFQIKIDIVRKETHFQNTFVLYLFLIYVNGNL